MLVMHGAVLRLPHDITLPQRRHQQHPTTSPLEEGEGYIFELFHRFENQISEGIGS